MEKIMLLLIILNISPAEHEIIEIQPRKHPDLTISIPETPHLRPSITMQSLSPLNLDIISSDEDERMCEVAVSAYFRSSHTHIQSHIRPFIKQLIQEAHDSPQREHREGINSLRRMISGVGDDSDQRALRYIHDIVTEATQKALLEQQKEIDAMQKKIDELWPKRKVGIVTSVTGIATALIGAGVTLAITFGAHLQS